MADLIHNRQPKYLTYAHEATTKDLRARLRGRDLFREHLKFDRPVFGYSHIDSSEEAEGSSSAALRRQAKQTDLMD